MHTAPMKETDMPQTKRQIEKEIASLQRQIDGMSALEAMGVRELARASGVSPTTAMRAKRGEVLSKAAMTKLLPFMNNCPCCGQAIK